MRLMRILGLTVLQFLLTCAVVPISKTAAHLTAVRLRNPGKARVCAVVKIGDEEFVVRLGPGEEVVRLFDRKNPPAGIEITFVPE